jgi:hypothetical protein
MEEQEGIGIEKQQEKMEEEKEKEEGNNAPEIGFAKWVAVRRKFAIDSPFFSAGNVERELLAKQVCWMSLGWLSPSLSLHVFPLFIMEVSLSWRSSILEFNGSECCQRPDG